MTENGQESMKTIFDCWSEAIRRFFDVRGRTTRYEFWAFQTVSLFVFIAAALIGFIFDAYKIVFEIYALYFVVPAATAGVRRLHDIGMSGKLIIPAPLLTLLVLACWEHGGSFVILPVFLLLCCVSYIYFVLSAEGETQDNIYGARVSEPAVYNDDSKVFVIFMTVFLAVLWIIFLAKVLF